MCAVTADGLVNHKHLSSHNHKPEAGQGCLLDALRHNTDKYNDQQPLTIRGKRILYASTHFKIHTRGKLWNMSSPQLCLHLIWEVSKWWRLPAFNDERNPKSGEKWKFADSFNKGITNLSECSPIPRCWEFGGKHSSSHNTSLSSVHFHKCCWLSHLHQEHC